MTNIFQAFKDYELKLVPAPPAPRGYRAWTPEFVETLEDRRLAMARIRAAYPELFYRPEETPEETPVHRLERLSEDCRAATITASAALLTAVFGPPPQPAPTGRPPVSPPFTERDAR